MSDLRTLMRCLYACRSAGVTEMMNLAKNLAPRFAAEFPYFRFELLTPTDFHADKASFWTTL